MTDPNELCNDIGRGEKGVNELKSTVRIVYKNHKSLSIFEVVISL